MEDMNNKDDGLMLILEPGYNLEDLRKYIKETSLARKYKCSFLETTNEVEDICKGFLELLNSDELCLDLDEISTLFVAASMVYFINTTPKNLEWRMHFLHRTFRYVDTLNPMHLHFATKRMWEGLKSDGISFVLNMLTICHQISVASETGRAIAICLTWAILSEITETKIEMYCFHQFSELLQMLNDIDEEVLQREDSTQIVYILVQVVGFLMNSIVFGNNEDLKKAGYRNYFKYSRRNLEKLKDWADHITNTLKVSGVKTSNFWDLRMSTNEYVNSNIISILTDAIADMEMSVVK